ncbi:MAG: hypothetical protein LBS48_02160, partial [Treponema sp.]|nr:hypothetical protein [Treponema sp.]
MDKISLNGEWNFALDPCEKGEKEKWFLDLEKFPGKARVPGAVQEQDIGFSGRFGKNRTLSFHESFNELDPVFPLTESECYCDAWYARKIVFPVLRRGDHV